MGYADDLRDPAGRVLPRGGRLVADLITAARERGLEVPEALWCPVMCLEPEEVAGLLALDEALVTRGIMVPRRAQLLGFLREAGGEVELQTACVPASQWLSEAIAYYRQLGFFASPGTPERSELEQRFPSFDEGVTPSAELEGWLVSLDTSRFVHLPLYPGWTMEQHCREFVLALSGISRGQFELRVGEVRSRQDEDPAWSQAPLGQDHVEVDFEVCGTQARACFHYESKYALRVDLAVPTINEAIARCGYQYLVSHEAGGLVLLSAREAERLARDRGLAWRDPAKVNC